MTNDVGHWRFRFYSLISPRELRAAIAFGRAAVIAAVAATLATTAAVAAASTAAATAAAAHAELGHIDLHRLALHRFVFGLLFGRQRSQQFLAGFGAKLI